LGDAFLHLLRAQKCREASADSIEERCRRGGLFSTLDFVPAPEYLRGVGAVSLAEDMRMPVDQLLGNAPSDCVQVESPLFCADLRVENHLEKNIAEFLAKVSVISGVDRGDDFI
jgi:hypothetical protein